MAGDEVEEFQPLCEVQSDKATIEITSRYKGKVVQFLYVPGDIVRVRFHHPIVTIWTHGNLCSLWMESRENCHAL